MNSTSKKKKLSENQDVPVGYYDKVFLYSNKIKAIYSKDSPHFITPIFNLVKNFSP